MHVRSYLRNPWTDLPQILIGDSIEPWKWFNIFFYSGRWLYQYNKNDFRFWFISSCWTTYDTHEHRSQEKLSIKRASLYMLVNLWFEKSLSTFKTLKSRLHCIDVIAYHCSCRKTIHCKAEFPSYYLHIILQNSWKTSIYNFKF